MTEIFVQNTETLSDFLGIIFYPDPEGALTNKAKPPTWTDLVICLRSGSLFSSAHPGPRCQVPPPVSFGASIRSELATEVPVEHSHRSVSNREKKGNPKGNPDLFAKSIYIIFLQTPSASICPAISRRPLVGTNYIFFLFHKKF